MTDSFGVAVAQVLFDPFGRPTVIVESAKSDFGFAGMYAHVRSRQNLTFYRQYSSDLGRWLSRDPLHEAAGVNLYSYVNNEPISYFDKYGLGRRRSKGRGGHLRPKPSLYCRSYKCCIEQRDICVDRCLIHWTARNLAQRFVESGEGTDLESLDACRRCCTGRRMNCFSAVAKKKAYPKRNFDCAKECIWSGGD